MRLVGILVALSLVAIAAYQSVIGGSQQSEAEETIVLAASDICTVDAVSPAVLATETREVVTTPAHKKLTVTDARYGTRTETITIVPEHREGATFFAEPKRIIVSEPTRRLRAKDPVFDIGPSLETRSVSRFHVKGGELVEVAEALPPLPDSMVVIKKARIEAVRINAGLKMIDTKIIDMDGEGDLVPAETMEVEVRTVEAAPAVETETFDAVTETVQVEIVATPARRTEAAALCTIADHPPVIALVQDALAAKGIDAGMPGEWSPATIDAIAAAQADATGLVSAGLLVETLRAWVPELDLPETQVEMHSAIAPQSSQDL